MGIQSVERAIDILTAIADKRDSLGLPELSKILDLPKTTIYTLVKTLRSKGFVEQDPVTRKYCLGFSLYELGIIQISELEIQRAASATIDQLTNTTNLESRLGIWNKDSVIISLTAHPIGQNKLTREIGPRIPAYCSALGKAILAFLPEEELNFYLANTKFIPYTKTTLTSGDQLKENILEIRERGYSLSQGELISYRFAMGAPVFGHSEKLEGAISLSLDQHPPNPENQEALSTHLLRAAHEISMTLGCPYSSKQFVKSDHGTL